MYWRETKAGRNWKEFGSQNKEPRWIRSTCLWIFLGVLYGPPGAGQLELKQKAIVFLAWEFREWNLGAIIVTVNWGVKIPERRITEEVGPKSAYITLSNPWLISEQHMCRRDSKELHGKLQLGDWKSRIEILASGHWMETEFRAWVLPSLRGFHLNSRKVMPEE